MDFADTTIKMEGQDMRSWVVWAGAIILLMGAGCANLEKDTKPVVDPIRKTSDEILKERKFGADDKTQAILFPRDEEQEKSQFKIKF